MSRHHVLWPIVTLNVGHLTPRDPGAAMSHLFCSHVALGEGCLAPREPSRHLLQLLSAVTADDGRTTGLARTSGYFITTGHTSLSVDLKSIGSRRSASEMHLTHFFVPLTHPVLGCTTRSLVTRWLLRLTNAVLLTPNTSPGPIRPHSRESSFAPSRT